MKQLVRLPVLAMALSLASVGTAHAATQVCASTTTGATCAAPSFTYATDDAGIFGHVFPILRNSRGQGVAGSFTDTYTFETTRELFGTFRVGSTSGTATNAADRFNFTTVTINGTTIPVTTTLAPGGTTQTRSGSLFDFRLTPGTQTLVIGGDTGRNGSYNGTFTLVAVPEPATWAMMIVGFGMVGAGMRRQRRATAKVAFA